jgi:hypothetical protein
MNAAPSKIADIGASLSPCGPPVIGKRLLSDRFAEYFGAVGDYAHNFVSVHHDPNTWT